MSYPGNDRRGNIWGNILQILEEVEMIDIVERLRDPEQGLTASDRFHLHKDAAAEIERLRHENMRLSTANEYALGPAGELAKCRAETERLKAALREMLHAIGHDRKELVDGAADRARVTLEETRTRSGRRRGLPPPRT